MSRRVRCCAAGGLLALLVVLIASPAAHAARLPVYTSPGFAGSTKAPPTKPAPPPPAKGATGTLRFTTGDLRGGRRTVSAMIEHDGLVTDQVSVGSYTAPPPAPPGRARGVRVRATGTRATVTWQPARGAARYLVALRGSHGLRRQVVTRARRVVLRGLAPGDRISAAVQGLSASGRRGPAARSGR